MKSLNRRQLLRGALSVSSIGVLAGVTSFASRAQTGDAPRVINITAKRFEYVPNEIQVKLGEKIVLAITSLDFVHGMNIPDLGVRADLMPGRITRIELEPKKVGNIDFVCDNFCGDRHEEMHGRLVVTA